MKAKKKYLFIPISGLGYLYPFIRLAKILEERNHQVLFATTVDYSIMLQSLGIENIGVRNDVVPFLYTGTWFYHDKAPNELEILNRIVEYYKPDVIITNPLVLISFIIAEKYNIPIINLGYNEYLFPTLDDPEIKKWRFDSITNYYNAYRKVLNMSEISCSALDSPLIGNLHLLRSIPELDNFAKMPKQVTYIGDLYWQPSYENITLKRFIAKSKEENKPIVYIQMGRLFEEFKLWEKLLTILGQLPYSFIADIGRSDYIEPQFQVPDNFYLNPFIPIGSVVDDIEFVICTGQSTSVIASIVHGKQLIVIPHSADSQEFTKKMTDKNFGFGFLDKDLLTYEILSDCFEQLRNNKFLNQILAFQKQFAEFNDDVIYEKIAII